MSENHREIDLTPVAETQQAPPPPVTAPDPAPATLIGVLKLIIKVALEAQSQPPGKKKDKPDVIGGWVAGGPPGLDRR
jgi:hypothetical protein